MNNIIHNDIATIHFAKDPKRQNLAEKCQLEYLQTQKARPTVDGLPSQGIKAIYFVDGEKITGCKTKPATASNSTKSIDFLDTKDNSLFYAKMTQHSGGSQDDHYKDCVCFIEQANLYLNKHTASDEVFILLVDGAYYTNKKKQSLRDQIDIANLQQVRVCSCDDI